MQILVFCFIIFLGVAENVAENSPQSTIHPKDLHSQIGGRIINGNPATTNQFPWQVSVLAYDSEGSTAVCGGSIISSQWVLTAAHCVDGYVRFTLGFGSTVFNSGTTIGSTYSIKYPTYNPQTYNNDIALIQPQTTIPLGTSIQVIRLPTLSQANTSFSGSTVTLSGWGQTADGGTTSNTLNYVNLLVILNTACTSVFGPGVIISSTVCAAGPTTNPNAGGCQGDSGGPLILNESGTYTQIGVLSFVASRGCQNADPSGFVRTASFLEWINAQTGVPIRP